MNSFWEFWLNFYHNFCGEFSLWCVFWGIIGSFKKKLIWSSRFLALKIHKNIWRELKIPLFTQKCFAASLNTIYEQYHDTHFNFLNNDNEKHFLKTCSMSSFNQKRIINLKRLLSTIILSSQKLYNKSVFLQKWDKVNKDLKEIKINYN